MQRVFEGAIVYVCGYEFTATQVRVDPADGRIHRYPAVRFVGVCTPSKRNDPIRNTGYNGGTYGGNWLAHYEFEGDENPDALRDQWGKRLFVSPINGGDAAREAARRDEMPHGC